MLKKISNLNLQKKEKYFYISTFIVLCISILSNSFIDTNGFLSNDSTHFLKLAESLKTNKGFYVYSWTNSGQINFFSMWPIGYPTIIYLISEITFLDVFWSSKLLNILCILLIFLIIYKNTQFGYSLIGFFFLAGSFLNIFSYTLTENLFIFGLISYAYSTHNLEINPSKRNIFIAFLSFIITFTSRYIGGYLIIFNFYLIVKSFQNKNKNFKNLMTLFFFSLLYMGVYLFSNKYLTGFVTYPHAYLTYEPSYEIILQFFKKIFEELNFIMASVRFSEVPIFSLVSYILSIIFFITGFLYCKQQEIKNFNLNKIANNFISLSCLYLTIVLIWRLTIWFSPFSYRILFPASILIFIGFAYKILSRTDINFRGIKKIYFLIIFLGFISFGYNIIYKQISFDGISYKANIERIKIKYEVLKKGDGIIFGERQLDYIKPDLIPLKPYYLPLFSEIESLEEFNSRLEKFDKKYMNIPPICKKPYQTLSGDRSMNCISLNKKIHNFDEGIINYIKKNKSRGLHKISEIK